MNKLFPIALAVAVALAAVAASRPAATQELTTVEKLYADLSKLSPDERNQRLIDGAKKEGEVVLTSGYSGKEGIAHLMLFEKRYGVKVKFVNVSSQQSVEQMIQETTAGRILTDIASVSGPDLGPIIQHNIGARNPTPATKAILSPYQGFNDPTGQNRWIPWYATSHGIGYNPSIMKDEDAPKSWQDLCNPKYKNQMSFETLEVRMLLGLYFMFDRDVEKVRQFLECIGKNEPIVMKGHTTRMTLLLAGDHPLSPDLLIYRGVYDNRRNPKKAPFKVVYSAPVFMDTSDWVINKRAPHPNAAALFVDWSLGEESQRYMFDQFRETLSYRHPFFPDNVQIVTANFADQSVVDTLSDYWKRYLGAKR